METLGSIGTDVKGITYALNQSIGGENGRQKLDEIVDNIRVLTAEFRSMSQENHAAINNTMANVETITSEMRDRLPKIAKQFEDLGKNLNGMVDQNKPELKGLMGDVRKLAQGFQSTSENIRSITDKMNKGEGTIGKLLNDDTTILKLNTAVDNVNEMLGGMKNMELRLDMGGARWTSRGDSQVGLGIEIAPRKDYWYSVGLSSTPDGKLSESTRTLTPDRSPHRAPEGRRAEGLHRHFRTGLHPLGRIHEAPGRALRHPRGHHRWQGRRRSRAALPERPLPHRRPGLRFLQAGRQAQSPLPCHHQLPALEGCLRSGPGARTSGTRISAPSSSGAASAGRMMTLKNSWVWSE